MPFIEDELIGCGPETRKLAGESMGGFNALQLVLKRPDLFDRAALICPAIPSISPRSNKTEVQKYIQRTGAKPSYIHSVMEIGSLFFPDENDWDNSSPLSLGKLLLNSGSPPLFIYANLKDEFGFYEGAKEFFTLAEKNNANITWKENQKGHCEGIDPQSVGLFIIDE